MAGTFAEVPVPEMRQMFQRLRGQERVIAEESLDLAAPVILGEGQSEAPVRTGFLANDSAFDDRQDDGSHVIGFGASYALAVHETHPTKSRFFINAIVRHGRRVIGGSLEIVLQRRIK